MQEGYAGVTGHPPSHQAGTSDVDEPDGERLRLSDVGKLARRTRRRIVGAARADEQVTFRKLLLHHLELDPASLDVVSETWPSYDHVNVQAGLDAWLDGPGRTHEILGVINFRHREFGLSELMSPSGQYDVTGVGPGTVARVNLPAGPGGEVRPSVVCAVYLVSDGDRRAALLFRMGQADMGRPSTTLEIGSGDPAFASELAGDVRRLALERNVYRGQVVSFGHDMFGERNTVLSFHHRPVLSEDDVVLPAATLEDVRRQVVGVARHRERLLAARQHLKRGLLLYGPPGVGKTHTVRYLVSQLTDCTVVQMSGTTLRMIEMACSVARTLQPALIVIEDVDLIAEERGMHPGAHPMLFQLLNEMDGLDEDADVVFLLTTNRADLLEPALAQRPGRVDQAVELALPDLDARRRLFMLYRGGLDVDESRLDDVLARSEGVTASFLKELLRRAAVLAAEQPGSRQAGEAQGSAEALRVGADQLDAALDDLLDTRNAMTRALLGGPPATPYAGLDGPAGMGGRFVGSPEPSVFPGADG